MLVVDICSLLLTLMTARKSNILICFWLISIFLVGCVSKLGPAASSDIEHSIESNLPPGHSAIIYANTAEWYPPAFAIGIGVLVLTDDNLYFLIWDNDHSRYDIPLQITYEKIIKVRKDTYGLTQELIVETERGNQIEYHMFKATKAGGAWVDNERTLSAFNLLSSRIQP